MKSNLPKVVLGGTFEALHRGHRALLKKAFSLGQVTIGLTSDKMARRLKKRKVKSFRERKRRLEDFAGKEFSARARILKIENKFGPTLKEDFRYIVVSPETYPTARVINSERKKKGRKPIKIVRIRFVRGKEGKPLSSSRMRR